MKCQSDDSGNWEFLKLQWSDYEIATGLDKRDESVGPVRWPTVVTAKVKDVQANVQEVSGAGPFRVRVPLIEKSAAI